MQAPQKRSPEPPPTAADDDSGVVAISDARALSPVRAAVQSLPLFTNLSDAERDTLASVASVVDYPKRSYLFHGGEPGQTLLILLSGAVEVRIERAGAAPVSLNTFERGDFLGEMSFFDGLPRSAAAVCLVDCEVLCIKRDPSLDPLMTRLGGCMLTELAKRVRHTDSNMTQLTDDIARAAYMNGHAAVAVELEAVKLLYRRTEIIAQETLDRAERRATEVMLRADSLAANVQAQVERIWSLLKRWVAPIVFGFGLLGAWLGLDKYRDLRAMYDDVKHMHEEVSSLRDDGKLKADELVAKYRRASALEETSGELRAVREAVGLDRELTRTDQLKRAALDYENAKQVVRKRYFSEVDGQAPFEPEVLFEAVDTYVRLTMSGSHDAVLRLNPDERRELLDAMCEVLVGLSAPYDASNAGSDSTSLLDQHVRDMVAFIAPDPKAYPAEFSDLNRRLSSAMVPSLPQRSRDNLALSLSSLQNSSPVVIQQLRTMLASSHVRRCALAAVALALLGDAEGYASLHGMLTHTEDEPAYIAALQLAEAGPEKLGRLRRLDPSQPDGPSLSQLIDGALRAHKPRNCLEERYTRYLSSCLLGTCAPIEAIDCV